MTGAVSRKTHGTAGVFDVPLSFTGASAVECRNGGASGQHTVVVTFSDPINAGQASVTAGSGNAGQPLISGNTMAIPLSNVADGQVVTLALSNVTTTSGQAVADATLQIGFLVGDSNGDRVVNSGDATQTRSRSGGEANSQTFRSDVNADGVINSGDTTIARGRSGQFLP